MSEPAPLVVFDDVAIDFAGRRLRRAGEVQPLEPKAFGVLALLAGAPGRVFSRDEILDAVWGHRHVTPGVLNRVMTLLRHALGEDAQSPHYLRTLHGVGYRFDMPAAKHDSSASLAPAPELEAETRSSVTRLQPVLRRASDRWFAFPRITVWLLPLLALLAFVGWKSWPRVSAVPATAVATPTAVATAPAIERSVAVLPLTNASNDPTQQFFSDGLSDNLIDALSRFDGLKVIGRMSSFRFRDGKDDSRTIGEKLGAAYLLSGSVQHAGDVVRINASLTRAADGSTLWAEHYDRPYKDLFALQDDITRAVAAALQAKLLSPADAAKQTDRPPSGNIDAYNAYLQGLKYWHDAKFLEASRHMASAVQLDPGYAIAWAHLSGSLSTVAMFGKEPPAVAREQMRQARLAVDKALQLAPSLGAAHAARAYLSVYGFDHQGALAECRRAVELAPDDGTVLNGCGIVLAQIGKLGEAIRLRERLFSLEPLYAINDFMYSDLLMATGRLDEAEKYLHIAEGLSPPESFPSYRFMYVAIARGDAATAQAIAGNPNRPAPWRDMNLAVAMQISPNRAEADAALAQVLADKLWMKTSPYNVAQIYALRDDPDKMVEWLQRAPAHNLLFLLSDPIILRFRNDPRLIAFCKKIGLPLPSESDALSIDQIRATLATKR